MLDLLLSRYSDIMFVMNMPFRDGYKQMIKAYEEHNEERLFDRWLSGYEKEMSFEEFKKELMKGTKSDREVDRSKTEDEIMEQVEEDLKLFRR